MHTFWHWIPRTAWLALVVAIPLMSTLAEADNTSVSPTLEIGYTANPTALAEWTAHRLTVTPQPEAVQTQIQTPTERFGHLDSPPITLDIDRYPYLAVALDHDSREPGGWTVVLDGKTPLTLHQYSSENGVLTFDLRQATGWQGTRTFQISFYVIGTGKQVALRWIRMTNRPLHASFDLTANETQAGFALIARKAFNVGLPDPGERANTLSLFAAPGEYEPATFLIYAERELREVRVALQKELRSGDDTLPRDCIDFRILKAWYQNTSQSPLGEVGLIPELLLKDDSLIQADRIAKRNRLAFTGRPVESPELAPFTVDAYGTAQLWLTVHVPTGTPPGHYRGAIEVRAANTSPQSIPIDIEVLPITLARPAFNFSVYYHNCIGGGSPVGGFPDSYEAELKDMSERGFTSVMIQEGVQLVTSNDTRRVVTDDLKRALDLRVKYGLTGPTIYSGFNWATKETDRLFRKPIEQITEAEKETFVLIAKAIVDLAASNPAYPELIFLLNVDEPGYDPTGKRLELAALNCNLLKQAGAKTATAINIKGMEALGDLLDVAILDEPAAESYFRGQDRPPEQGQQFCYWHPDENPVYDRFHYGVKLWQSGLDGALPWVYQWAVPGGWLEGAEGIQDATGGVLARRLDYTYSSVGGVVPTIQWEGAREGIDDLRYLETLAQLVKVAEGRPHTATLERELTTARALLTKLPPAFTEPTSSVLRFRTLTPEDFQQYRRKLADQIIRLQQVVQP